MSKESRSGSMLIAVIILALLVTAATYLFFERKGGFSVGDQVYGEWTTKVWYPGKINKTCEKGFNILYNDGDEKCLSKEELITDAAPENNVIKIGSKVIAQYMSGPFYEATVVGVQGDRCQVAYAFDKQVATKNLSEVR
ncbi:MAG: hypothetical protein WC101_02445, partial [Candidatus Gracilibacteria bacterium]